MMVRIAVLADATDSDKATKAGADKVGEETIFSELTRNGEKQTAQSVEDRDFERRGLP